MEKIVFNLNTLKAQSPSAQQFLDTNLAGAAREFGAEELHRHLLDAESNNQAETVSVVKTRAEKIKAWCLRIWQRHLHQHA